MATQNMNLTAMFQQRKKSSHMKVKKKFDNVHAVYDEPSVGAETMQLVSSVTRGSDDTFDDVEEILKQFDLNMSYGPCLGVTRIERWERANRLGLKPPSDIKNLLDSVGGEATCLWEGRV